MHGMKRITKAEAEKYIVPGAIVTRVHHAGNTTNKIKRGVYTGIIFYNGRPALMYDVDCVSSFLERYSHRYIGDLFNGEVYVRPPDLPSDFKQILDDFEI